MPVWTEFLRCTRQRRGVTTKFPRFKISTGVSREYKGDSWCYIATMGDEKQTFFTVSPSLAAQLNELIPAPTFKIHSDWISRHINPDAVIRAQTFMAAQANLASRLAHKVQGSVEPMLNWVKSPKGRCELFMYKRSQIRDKFSKLVSTPIEFLVIVQQAVTKFLESKLATPVYGRRAQIMSIRGLALSCAPNFTRISDFNSFSRLHRGHA